MTRRLWFWLWLLVSSITVSVVPAYAMVNEVTSANRYTGNGSTTAFAYTWRVLLKTDIEVLVAGVVKTVDTDYTVTGLGASGGGSVTFSVAPANTATVTLLRKQPVSQASDYVPNEAFPAERIEKDLDKLAMQSQQQKEALDRAVKLPKSSTLSNIDFPEPGAGKFIRWNVGGTALEAASATGAGGLPLDPAACPSGQYVKDQNIEGVLVCQQVNFSELAGAATDAQVSNTITIDNLTQVTTRAIGDTTGDLAASRVDDGGAASTQALFSGAGSAAGFRAIADGDLPSSITRDTEVNVQGTANEITSTGSGVAPTLSLAATLDLSGKTSTKPMKTGTTAPVTCSVGEYFFDTDATGGQNTFACTLTDTWTLQGAAGAGSNHNLFSATHPDTVVASPVLGGIPYANATPAWQELAGNTTTAKQWLSQTGTGTISAVPAWSALADSDVPNTITIDLATAATALAADPTDCAANQFSTAIAANGNLTCAAIVDADVPNTITVNLAATATALAANPTDCAAGLYATTIAASGDLTCVQPAFSEISGSVTDAQVPDTITASNYVPTTRSVNTSAPLGGGGALSGDLTLTCATCTTNAAALTADQVVVGNGTQTAKTLAAGTAGHVLTMAGGIPAWSSPGAPAGHNMFSASHADTVIGSAVLGDSMWANATPAWDRLAGNITTAKKFLNQTGTGAVSAVPVWSALVDADIPNTITIDLATTATTASALVANGANCSAGQSPLGVDAAGAAEGCFTPTGVTHNLLSTQHPDTLAASPVLGGVLYGNSTPAWQQLAGNTTVTRKFLRQTGTGTVSATPGWDTFVAGDLPTGFLDATTDVANTLCTDGQSLTKSGGVWICGAPGTGITSLGVSGSPQTGSAQTFATGTAGTDFNITSAANLHTFNLPSASASNRGLVTTGTQTFGGLKTISLGDTVIKGPGPWIDVKAYGALGDNVADDITAIQAAITAVPSQGGIVYFPPGYYRISSAISIDRDGVTLRGAGPNASIIISTSTTANNVSIGAGLVQRWNNRINDLGFSTSVIKTAGSMIALNHTYDTQITNVDIKDPFYGISLFDSVITKIDRSRIGWYANQPVNSAGVLVTGDGSEGSVDTFIHQLSLDSGAWAQNALGGIVLAFAGGVHISDSDIIHSKRGLTINPGSGQIVQHLFVMNSAFDTASTQGIYIGPTAGGTVNRATFTGNWTSSNTDSGILVGGSGGTINTIRFFNHRSYLNGQHGVIFNSGTELEFSHGEVAGNSSSGSGAYNGISIAANVIGFRLIGNRSGAVGGFSNTQGWGILIAAGTSDKYIVTNNDVRTNLTGSLSDAGTGGTKQVALNLPLSSGLSAQYGSGSYISPAPDGGGIGTETGSLVRIYDGTSTTPNVNRTASLIVHKFSGCTLGANPNCDLITAQPAIEAQLDGVGGFAVGAALVAHAFYKTSNSGGSIQGAMLSADVVDNVPGCSPGAGCPSVYGAGEAAFVEANRGWTYAIGNEAEVQLVSPVLFPTTTTFNVAHFSAAYNASPGNTGFGVVDVAYLVNPLGASGFRRGFYVPASGGGPPSQVTETAFEDQSNATTSFKVGGSHVNGIDLSGGTYSGAALGIDASFYFKILSTNPIIQVGGGSWIEFVRSTSVYNFNLANNAMFQINLQGAKLPTLTGAGTVVLCLDSAGQMVRGASGSSC